MKAVLILEDGQVFEGERIGSDRDVICEMVFNTSVTGYIELLTDPSYSGQGVVMSSPIIGNYGVFPNDSESVKPWVEAFIVHYLTPMANDPRCSMDLNEYLKKHDIPGISGVDTRLLTLTIREKGTMKGMITRADSFDAEECLEAIRQYESTFRIPIVSTQESKEYVPGAFGPKDRNRDRISSTYDREGSKNPPYKVAMLDYGMKSNITRILYKYNCDVTWYSWNTPAETILASDPDGIMLSNGPGDPKDCRESIQEIKKIYHSDIPVFAICLGHQLMALAVGFDTYKLKYGHRGINHPVKELASGRCYITSQNHGYCVDAATIDPAVAVVSYVNVNDQSIEGMDYIGKDIFTVQFHPEGAAGPKDTEFLFERFIDRMENRRKNGSVSSTGTGSL